MYIQLKREREGGGCPNVWSSSAVRKEGFSLDLSVVGNSQSWASLIRAFIVQNVVLSREAAGAEVEKVRPIAHLALVSSSARSSSNSATFSP